MSFPFDRRSYRLPYPPTARAKFSVDGKELALVDCSERGLRYLGDVKDPPEIGTRIAGTVKLLSGGPAIHVEGSVVRIQSGEVAVELDAPGIGVQALFSEQRYLARRFPARFRG
ncbi:MAG: PilZ domain-containing protein [Gemmatimonadaceae bacterium]